MWPLMFNARTDLRCDSPRLCVSAVRFSFLLGVLLALGLSGCTFTGSGTKAPPAAPPEGTYRPRIEQSIGDFGFAWGKGELATPTIYGQLLSSEIVDAWMERGFAVGGQFVDDKKFSGQADYNLTVSGSQRNTASFWLEVLNALTVLLFPYSVTQHYDLNCVLE